MRMVPDLIWEQARRTPQAVAVESAGAVLSYAQLLAEAVSVADRLHRAGVGPGDLAAVAIRRTLDLVPALLGVQLAGAAYVPLDPEHPANRLNYILTDCRARVLLTADAADSPGLRAGQRIQLSDITVRPAGPPPAATVDPESAAYVIYTSGSTGKPKGVMVSHRAFANFVHSMRDRPGLPDDVVLPAVTTVSFDIAGLELFLPLTTGGRVVIARQAEATDPRRLAALLATAGARVMQATPVTWRMMLEAGWSPPPGFTVLCGGERLPAELADRLLGDQVVLWDLYGPTETTVWSSVTRYERGAAPSFSPVAETSLHLLDEDLQPVAPATAGELYIGGAGLAAGYLGRPGLTAGHFVADPFAGPGACGGGRLYRTGDVARRHPGGRIEILGRSDDQIKIRGFRIEPGEIEHLLTEHPAVAEAVVRALGDAAAPQLVGYIRPADPARPPDLRQLRLRLARSVPGYMIPAQFIVMDAFPRTPNGKLDRAALPSPAGPAPSDGRTGADGPSSRGSPSHGPAGSPTERRIAKVVAEVLERPAIGVHEDFFALGGDSLRAVTIVLRLNEELDTEIPISALFEVRTVYGLAALLDGDTSQPVPLPGGRSPRLSSAQWRLWLHQQTAPDSAVDNAALVVRLPGQLDLAAAESALSGLLDRHAILRTRYEVAGGVPTAITLPAAPARLTVADGDPREILAAELAQPFDLGAGPPLRVRIVRQADEGCALLLMAVHRIAADDWSLEVMARELRAAYRGRAVPAAPLSYGDYAEWQRERSASQASWRHLDFWRAALAGLDRTELPTSRPRPPVRDWRCGTVRFEVPAGVTSALDDLAAEHDATRLTVLLAGLCATLAGRTDGTDLAVGVPVTGRGRPELESVVGMLEETAVIRVNLGDRPGFDQLLTRVSEAMLAVEHAVVPFEDIVAVVAETEQAQPAPGRNPVFDVFFALHPAPADPAGFPLPDAPGTRYDLSFHLTERVGGGLDGRLEYATQLFDEADVASLASGYVELLARACPAAGR